MCSTAQAVDLNIVTPVATECVASQRAMATGVAGQEVDIVESDILLDIDIANADFFSATVSIAAHSCGAQPCQRAVDGNGADALDAHGHPVYSNAILQRTISASDFFFADVEQRQFAFGYDGLQDGNVVLSVTLTYNCFDENGDVYPFLADDCQGLTADPAPPSMVAFMLDRRPPNVEFTAGQIETINNTANTCNINNEVINPAVSDETSTVTLSEVVDTQAGCSLDRTFRAIDSCGNGVEYVWSQFSPPNQGDIDITLDGYVCQNAGCIADPNTMTPFASGASVIGAQVLVNIDAAASCVTD
jgi:hypothetical protein